MRKRSRHWNAKNTLNIALLMLFISLFSSTAFAIGVAPSKRIIDYRPGEEVSYSIDIINNGQEDLDVMVYPRGKYSDRIQLDWKVFKMGSSQEKKTINVWFTIPEIEDAGPHELEIVAVGSTPTPEGSEAVVKADIAVVSKLIIDVPYPEKYAEARIYVLDTEKGKPVTISIPFFNKGSTDINEAYAEVTLLDAQGNEIDRIQSAPQMVKKGKDVKFTLTSNKAFDTGQYKAAAKVHYDGSQREVETGFSIGDLKIDIRSLVVDEFTLGDVARFDILLFNSWSAKLSNVYAEMQITDTDNNVLTSFKTVAADIPANDLGVLEGYWYTEGVSPGIYTATIQLYYANRVEQKAFSLEVQPNAIIATPLGTGLAISAEEEVDLTNNAYLILLVLVMGGIIAGLVYKLKKKGEAPGAEAKGKGPAKEGKEKASATEVKEKSSGTETKEKETGTAETETSVQQPLQPKPVGGPKPKEDKQEQTPADQPDSQAEDAPEKSGWAAVEQELHRQNGKQDSKQD